jgi:succinate dehydrogenase/fumarate reductase-like Fe-S protein
MTESERNTMSRKAAELQVTASRTLDTETANRLWDAAADLIRQVDAHDECIRCGCCRRGHPRS